MLYFDLKFFIVFFKKGQKRTNKQKIIKKSETGLSKKIVHDPLLIISDLLILTIKITKLEKKVFDTMKSVKNEEEIYRIRKIIENLRRISEYASDIGEIVLNTNIEKMIKKR